MGFENATSLWRTKSVKRDDPMINLRYGHPTLLDEKLDNLVQIFLKATWCKGEAVNSTIAIATAKALIKRCPLLEKENNVLGISWAKSLFQRLGFIQRKETTGEVTIPGDAQKEAELKFLHEIVNQVEKYKVPLYWLHILMKLCQNIYKCFQIQWKRKESQMFIYMTLMTRDPSQQHFPKL